MWDPQHLTTLQVSMACYGDNSYHEMLRCHADILLGAHKWSDMVSLNYCSRHTRCTADQAPYTLLFGDPHLTETLEGFKFRVSPDSFFQVNTAAAAVLYNTVCRLARLTPMTTLLDVCCGTGGFVVLLCLHLVSETHLLYWPVLPLGM
jgi:hypothetical protein